MVPYFALCQIAALDLPIEAKRITWEAIDFGTPRTAPKVPDPRAVSGF
jgi:hypothetical protein